jgi:hypothetical protein
MGLIRVGEKLRRPNLKLIMTYKVASLHTGLRLSDHLSLARDMIGSIRLGVCVASNLTVDRTHIRERACRIYCSGKMSVEAT